MPRTAVRARARAAIDSLRPAGAWLAQRRVDGVPLGVLARRLRREFAEDDVPGMAAALSYRFLFALFPFLVFLAAMGGLVSRLLGVDDPTGETLDLLGTTLPDDAARLVSEEVERAVGTSSVQLLALSMLGTIWAATGGANALVRAINRAYNVLEGRPWWRRYLLALGLTLGGGVAVVTALSVIVVGEVVGARVAEAVGAHGAFALLLVLARIPVALLALLLVISFVYWAAPNREIRFRLVTPGAVVFATLWVGASYAFGVYVARFASYSATYGTLGTVIVLMLWFYLSSMSLLAGAEVNAAIAHEQEREAARTAPSEG